MSKLFFVLVSYLFIFFMPKYTDVGCKSLNY
jgi:hypothetical protein